jgi:long-subunit acyl-CoA synthetase (AMP-forming)
MQDVVDKMNMKEITIVYGQTEASPGCTMSSTDDPIEVRVGTVGGPLPGVECKIVDPETNEEVPVGVTGEFVARGYNIMKGYYKMPEATAAAIDKDGWLHTGDLGYIDKDGYVFITGRKKNVVVLKNGKNIYPEELELLINNLPYVAESMVFGWPEDDGDLTLTVKIVYNKDYVEKNYMDKSKEEFEQLVWNDIKKINSTLTNYKHMKKLILTDEEMIKTTTSKVKRFQEIEKILKEGK